MHEYVAQMFNPWLLVVLQRPKQMHQPVASFIAREMLSIPCMLGWVGDILYSSVWHEGLTLNNGWASSGPLIIIAATRGYLDIFSAVVPRLKIFGGVHRAAVLCCRGALPAFKQPVRLLRNSPFMCQPFSPAKHDVV